MHRFSYPAARASECAAAQGRFKEFYDLVFAQQDSLGLKPFDRFAKESGVVDSAAFKRCNALTTPVAVVDRDKAVVIGFGGEGTPTIAINGLLYPSPPDSAAMDSIVNAAIKSAASR
jgi:protein-disulfide isomerase